MSDEIVIESIKKMLQLNMPQDEILASLVDAGVDYDYAIEMLDSVQKNKPLKENKSKKQEEDVPELKAESEEDNDLKEVDKTSLGVWQEGVTTIITQKLDDIEAKQNNLDNEIKTKISEITSVEIAKMKAVIDSQRTLLASKMDMSISSKLKEVKDQIDKTVKDLQSVNANTEKKLQDIDAINKSMIDLKTTLKEQIETVSNLKESLDSTLDDFKRDSSRELTRLFDQYKAQLEDITNRTNSTMNLAGKILDSLVNASKNKIDAYLTSKINSFTQDLQSKLNVTDLKTALDKLNTIKDLDSKIGLVVDNKLATFATTLNSDKYSDSITDFNRRLMELERYNKSSGSVGSADLDEINSKIDELMMYKEQNSNIIAKLMKDKDENKKK